LQRAHLAVELADGIERLLNERLQRGAVGVHGRAQILLPLEQLRDLLL